MSQQPNDHVNTSARPLFLSLASEGPEDEPLVALPVASDEEEHRTGADQEEGPSRAGGTEADEAEERELVGEEQNTEADEQDAEDGAGIRAAWMGRMFGVVSGRCWH